MNVFTLAELELIIWEFESGHGEEGQRIVEKARALLTLMVVCES